MPPFLFTFFTHRGLLGACLLVIGVAGLAYGLFAADDGVILHKRVSNPWYIDETRRAFRQRLTLGDPVVILSPDRTKAFPAELCFWNKSGQIESSPAFVLLNTYMGKPEPTFCPHCGRRVVLNNPAPNPDDRPPTCEELDNASH